MTPDERGAIRGWADKELRDLAEANYGLGADAGLPDEMRFTLGVIRATKERSRVITEQGGPVAADKVPALFFFSPEIPEAIDRDDLDEVPMLNNGQTALSQRFWLMGPTSNYGRGLALDAWNDDADVFAHAVSLGLADVPAIVLDSRTDPARLWRYPNGVGELASGHELPLQGRDLSIDEVFQHIDNAHQHSLRIPQGPASFRLWKEPGKLWPVEKVEEAIQEIVRMYLQGALYPAFVRAEQPQPSGRIDLVIEESIGPSTFVRHVLLELKALRAFGSTGSPVSKNKNRTWVSEGVDQVAAYRTESESKVAALCCFDLREEDTGDECFKGVKTKARSLDVNLRAWHIFPSAKAARKSP